MDKYLLYKTVLSLLRETYTRSDSDFIRYGNNLELIIGTVLSAQCTDKRVNEVTSVLFEKYRCARDYAEADFDVLRREIFSVGFYNVKARYLIGIGHILVEQHGGEVPCDFEALLELPGVSNKTANLVMAKGFGVDVGVAVDTHVKRLAPRIGLCGVGLGAEAIERELNALVDSEDYLDLNEFFILHGRAVCGRRPECEGCVLRGVCGRVGVK